MPDGHEGTFAEIPSDVKNTISHRFRSLNMLREYVSTHRDEIAVRMSSSGVK